jgi:dihydropyrimidine dehydrogenase (NAD+) subunit PreA
MTTDLRSEWVGLSLRNPFLLASAPPTGTPRRIIDADRAGWAGAITKTLTSTPPYEHNLARSIDATRAKGWRQVGILNNELVTEGSLDQWCSELLPAVRAEVSSGFCLGVSVMEGIEPSVWRTTCARASSHASYLELNVSCPHGQPEKFRGTFVGDDPQLLQDVVAAAVDAADVPVAVKLNAVSPTLVESARAALAGGAAGLVTTNTFAALASVERLLGKDSDERLTPMGVSGAAVLPVNRLATATLASQLDCQIMSVGGVSSAADALDYLMLGARAVQVGTAAMVKGLSLITALTSQLERRLEQTDESDVRLIIGSALGRLSSADDEQAAPPQVASVDMPLCTLCNACIEPCSIAGADCLTLGESELFIDQARCTGCGLCVIICPTNALTLTGRI